MVFHILAISLVVSAAYFEPLDLLLSIIYIAGIMAAGGEIGKEKVNVILAGIISQLPGIVLLIFCLDCYFISHHSPPEYGFFLQWWLTPYVPLLSLTGKHLMGVLHWSFLGLFFVLPLHWAFLAAGSRLQRWFSTGKQNEEITSPGAVYPAKLYR